MNHKLDFDVSVTQRCLVRELPFPVVVGDLPATCKPFWCAGWCYMCFLVFQLMTSLNISKQLICTNGLVCLSLCVLLQCPVNSSHSILSTASTCMTTTPPTPNGLCHSTTTSTFMTRILLAAPLYQIIVMVCQVCNTPLLLLIHLLWSLRAWGCCLCPKAQVLLLLQ